MGCNSTRCPSTRADAAIKSLRAASSITLGYQFVASPHLQVALCNAVTSNRLNPSHRLPACLMSVREGALPGSTLWLQIQHNGSRSHKPRLHGWLEAFGATFCPVCLQAPEEMEQAIINSGSNNAVTFGLYDIQSQTKIMFTTTLLL